MRQLLQDLSSGETHLVDLPAPEAGPGRVLLSSRVSLISAGTERMLVEFGRAGWVNKARQQPDKLREVLHKARTDGVLPTIEAVRGKLDEPLPLGYSNVGVVESVGSGIDTFRPGDRVVSNGPHAEMVSVPRNLCARIPSSVTDEEAAFTVIGAIALQGIRLAEPTLGECFAVTGLGLVGLLTVQILHANGCRVIAIDTDPEKTAIARQFGAETVDIGKGEDPVEAALAFSRQRGVDGVLLTLATTDSKPVSQAANMARKRGRIVLVGVAGLELNRADFYEKELTFQVSCSYGPGRYDPVYEEQGRDYPLGYVRWTEQRNFEAVLDLMASGTLDVRSLITHRFDFSSAPQAYDLLSRHDESYLGILLEYPSAEGTGTRTVELGHGGVPAAADGKPGTTQMDRVVACGVIGAGNHAGRVLIPAFRRAGASLEVIANSGGPRASHYGRKYGFARVTTDVDTVLASPKVDAVVIATRHDSHARYACQALHAGKHVFCEKPLALTQEELAQIASAHDSQSPRPVLMVGFNRRFAPHMITMKRLLESVISPKSFMVTVNAGAVPGDHWIRDPDVGGGRIVGEVCHFIDLLRHLAGAPIVEWQTTSLIEGERSDDCVAITLRFSDGSFGTIHYLTNGHSAFPKERIEVFCAARTLQLDNFRLLRGHGWPGFRRERLWRQDKGQNACARAFVDAVREGRSAPIPLEEILEVSRLSIEIAGAQV